MGLTIIPLKFTNLQLLDELKLRLSFHFDTIKVESFDIDIEETYNVQRQQYYSTKIIEIVKKITQESEGYNLIITEMDLFVPVLTHIYGEAELRGRYSIVSTCRLHEEFYTSERNPELLLERTFKK
jgi:archaemetzincin